MSDQYSLRPPDYQRRTIVKMAARIKAFFAILGENNHTITNPQNNFVQFFKDITYAMVGNKRCEHGEVLLKALSHFGTVRVPRDRVKQIFTGRRGRQYTVIREEFRLEGESGARERYAYRVSKTTGTSSTRTTSKWCWEMTSPTSGLQRSRGREVRRRG